MKIQTDDTSGWTLLWMAVAVHNCASHSPVTSLVIINNTRNYTETGCFHPTKCKFATIEIIKITQMKHHCDETRFVQG